MNDVTTDTTATVNSFVEAWNETNPARRAERLREACTQDVRYANDAEAVQGYDGLQRMVAELQAQYPGHHIKRASVVDAHANGLRFTWQFLDPAGGTVATGMEVATLGPDGRLQSLISFNGTEPEQA